MRLGRPCWSLVVTLAWPAAARAQDAADVARRQLIADAAAASGAGDHARAVALATRAAALRATPSLQYFLAREHLALGRPVEALARAGDCAAGARADRDLRNRAALIARCEAVAAEADRGVARLTVRVAPPTPEGLRVAVAGAPLAPALYDVAVPVAPGAVEVTATAVGRAAFRATLTLAAGASDALTVTLEDAPPPPRAQTAPPPALVSPPSPPPPRPASIGAGPWALAGIGALGLAVGGALGALALDAQSGRDAACAAAWRCDAGEALRLDARYRDEALGANVAFGVGAAALVGAAAWWVVARVTRRPAARVAFASSGVALRW